MQYGILAIANSLWPHNPPAKLGCYNVTFYIWNIYLASSSQALLFFRCWILHLLHSPTSYFWNGPMWRCFTRRDYKLCDTWSIKLASTAFKSSDLQIMFKHSRQEFATEIANSPESWKDCLEEDSCFNAGDNERLFKYKKTIRKKSGVLFQTG